MPSTIAAGGRQRGLRGGGAGAGGVKKVPGGWAARHIKDCQFGADQKVKRAPMRIRYSEFDVETTESFGFLYDE